jgi:hypothetical protein
LALGVFGGRAHDGPDPVKLRYVRVGDHLDDGTQLVVRGGQLEPGLLRRDAERMHAIYGVYGISVFAVRDATLPELAQQAPLVRFVELSLMTFGVIRAGGFPLEPTGRNPRHYTVHLDDLGGALHRLCALEHEIWPNPYHDGESR